MNVYKEEKLNYKFNIFGIRRRKFSFPYMFCSVKFAINQILKCCQISFITTFVFAIGDCVVNVIICTKVSDVYNEHILHVLLMTSAKLH